MMNPLIQINKTLTDSIIAIALESNAKYLADFPDTVYKPLIMKQIPLFAIKLKEELLDIRNKYSDMIFVSAHLINKDISNDVMDSQLFKDYYEEVKNRLLFLYRYHIIELIEEFYQQDYISFNVSNINVLDILENSEMFWAEYLASSIEDTIRQILVKGTEAGLGSYKIAQLITESSDFSYERAERIARTEILNANRAVEFAIYNSSEYYAKGWSSVGDSRVRHDHQDADSQIVKINEPFLVGGEQLMYPGDTSLGASPSNIIDCRCSVIYYTKEEYDSLIN